MMKQVEKLDLVLKALYEKPDQSGEIVELLKEKGIEVALNDAFKLGRRLHDIGYVKFIATSDSAIVDMKSEGIEFIEGDSFTHKGQPAITNNYTISNSPSANLVTHSTQVTITQHNASAAKHIIEQIKDAANKDASIGLEQRQELADCIEEVEAGIDNGKAPKIAFRAFLESASNLSSVGGLAIQLGQVLGLLPS